MLAELRRCSTCRRWGGPRRADAEGNTLLPDDVPRPTGPCIEGPWHGSPRGPRNACGQWVFWLETETPREP
ncbi:hypothetical protein E6C76_06990 [Pseudothauera nasutitermitis]|uniref:Uncharacterized protein n=1 Tax=Pseudothauera nasutitermitis TaxID=2565930 RepID=A0A4S4B4A0_9RHOO|nr:hypothetical protein [Pseudothauera nasutitermitis]THF66570.1 hypothetical protein E6C76_06990 [Pseudothauera nasutitermitis]